ncbi:MAG: heme o synthase [Bacteroidota bacterium]
MIKSKSYSTKLTWSEKINDYKMLVKMRLNFMVVISSILAFLMVSGGNFTWVQLLVLGLGGFFVTGAANALNQVLESEHDALMKRTANRPLAAGRMNKNEAVVAAGMMSLIGICLLALFNPLTAFLGMCSMILYAFVYTPLKRFHTAAVAVGAIPGALPVLIGCVAFEGSISSLALILFAIQFLWQFPHFWAIGFLAFDDYQKAGYKLLPEKDGVIDRNLGLHSFMYTIIILPLLGLSFFLGSMNSIAIILVVICTLIYAWFGLNFHNKFDTKSAKHLMFSSFFYLPVVLLILILGNL